MSKIIYYKDVISVLQNMPFVLTSEIRRREISYRKAAEEIGVSHSHVYNLANGLKDPSTATVILVLEWIMRSNKKKVWDAQG